MRQALAVEDGDVFISLGTFSQLFLTIADVCIKPELREVILPDAERQAALAARLPLYRDL